MKSAISYSVLLLLISIVQSQDIFSVPITNNEPIVGIMAIDMSFYIQSKYPEKYFSFIAASYVKFIEGGGARVVPVWIGKDRKYYEDIMQKLNGILFTGGSVWFHDSDYADSGSIIYDVAIKMNKNGTYFPLWGTCLGFELLTYLSANRSEHRADCSSKNQALAVEFKEDFKSSRIFREAPDQIVDILRNENVTANFHQYCVTEKNLTSFKIDTDWRVISTNKDLNDFEFISIIENRQYPFYGVQFHPEKNIYEWVRNKNIPHTANAILASQYFAQFFVNETRKNSNKFKDSKTEDQHVIYNFPTTFTGAVGSSYEECYLFKENIDYRSETNSASPNSVNYLLLFITILNFKWHL